MPALREAFAREATVPPRHVHAVGAGDDSGTVLIMPAWSEAGFLGIKTINIFPGNGARGLPGLHATYVLYDARTGVPLAQMDGNEITAHRTAAASALGASLPRARGRFDACWCWAPAGWRACCRRRTRACGRSARSGCGTTGPKAPRRWPPNGAPAGWDAQPARRPGGGRGGADIVSCATLATAPLVRGEWLAPGTHLDLIGSFTPAMKEADAACFAGARASSSTPTRRRPRPATCWTPSPPARCRWRRSRARWRSCAGASGTGRRSAGERTVFKAVGSALEDLAAATRAWHGERRRTGV